MISGLFVGFFSTGVYMFILMVVFGGIIKLSDPNLVVAKGEAIKSSINLPPTMFQGFDNIAKIPIIYMIGGSIALFVGYKIIEIAKKQKNNQKIVSDIAAVAVIFLAVGILLAVPAVRDILLRAKFPVVTAIMALITAVIILWLTKTKLGHDFLAIKYDIGISASVGINVDRTRIVAIILSTIFAGLGQMIYIQNLGTIQTYVAHQTVATFTIAAILIGGATIRHANIKNAVLGTILFNCIYSTAPNAAKNLFGNVQIGEYFRIFMCYGIIAVAIVVYAVKEVNLTKARIRMGTQ